MIDIPAIVESVASVLPARRPIGHHEPSLGDRELKAINKCFAQGLTGYKAINTFEDMLAARCGVRHAIAVSSGTAALHLALVAAGVKPNDEVLVPALTFVATANAVVHAGAIPNFIDGPLNINAYKLRCYLHRQTVKAPTSGPRVNRNTGRPVTAIVAVDLLGVPANMAELEHVANEFGLVLIEDAAEALGSRIGNRACGSFGRASILSFNNNKIVTTGGGGAVLTDDDWLAAKVHQLATTARMPHAWAVEHDAVAWNYRIGNINAAVGCAQMERLDEFLEKKRKLFERYRGRLADCADIELLDGDDGAGSVGDRTCNNWLTAMKLDPRAGVGARDALLGALCEVGIMARALFTPLHMLPMYRDNPRDNLLSAEDAWRRTVCLPSGADL